MAKNFIFDLNGVIIVSQKLSERFAEDFKVPPERFLPVLRDVLAITRRPGAESAYSYWKPHLDAWHVKMDEQQFLNYWFKGEQENQEMVTLARKLHEDGNRLFLVSNNFRERAEYYAKHFPCITELFEKVYYSWQTGFVKPDIRAYELVLRENNLVSQDTFYFDDSGENVVVAKGLGIRSYLYTNPTDVRKYAEAVTHEQ
ncbi:HAD-IA family hydrolase [Candidatus Kaiserbacteria bacterium]|nr:HAD-IA family hydrolase [Candidatus Kaiserbacteria bacterium]